MAISTGAARSAIGHTRMSTESRIDLSHSQPFWVHGVPDLATVHNGHVTNYHQLRRRYEQKGVTFYTDNDSEVIGVYLRERMSAGRSLPEALADSIADLDGAYNYLVVSSRGAGDRPRPIRIQAAGAGRDRPNSSPWPPRRSPCAGRFPGRLLAPSSLRPARRSFTRSPAPSEALV